MNYVSFVTDSSAIFSSTQVPTSITDRAQWTKNMSNTQMYWICPSVSLFLYFLSFFPSSFFPSCFFMPHISEKWHFCGQATFTVRSTMAITVSSLMKWVFVIFDRSWDWALSRLKYSARASYQLIFYTFYYSWEWVLKNGPCTGETHWRNPSCLQMLLLVGNMVTPRRGWKAIQKT